MLKKSIFLTFCALFVNSAIGKDELHIIPAPEKYVIKSGHFIINPSTVIRLPDGSGDMRMAAEVFRGLFSKAAGIDLKTSVKGKGGTNVIECKLSEEIKGDEAYRLEVKPGGIIIEARTPHGLFYGFQTLRQLLPAEIESPERIDGVEWRIPCVKIEDNPVFGYRGMMLDPVRHFMPKEFVMKFIDLLAYHKLNTFHWHLTDDQGWRIEIEKYPKLTSVGGFRNRTLVGHARNKPPYEWDQTRYGGFYTKEDIREVVEYARSRFVTVIPEIEMPGHAVAALAAYPEYSCSGGPFEVEGMWGVFNDIFCCREETFGFLEDILDEVMELFPSEYIHIGGDEAPKIRWKRCHACQEMMKEQGLETEEQLQTYFVGRIENYLSSHGRRIIGWDEIMEGGCPQRATVMSWRGIKGGVEAARQGYDVIMAPNTHLYFNHYQADPASEPLAQGGFSPLEKVYAFDPVPHELTPEEAVHIRGIQANTWSEYIATPEHMEYMLFPRAAALSELAWSRPENRDYDHFLQRLEHIFKRYDYLGVNYCDKSLR